MAARRDLTPFMRKVRDFVSFVSAFVQFSSLSTKLILTEIFEALGIKFVIVCARNYLFISCPCVYFCGWGYWKRSLRTFSTVFTLNMKKIVPMIDCSPSITRFVT